MIRKEEHSYLLVSNINIPFSLFLFWAKQAMTELFGKLWNLENTKRGYNVEIGHTCAIHELNEQFIQLIHELNELKWTEDSSSKFLLNTVSLFAAAPSLSGGGAKKFLPMFTHGGNVRKTTETSECFTVVYPTMETVGGNLVGLRLRIYLAVTSEGNLVWSWAISRQILLEFDHYSIPVLCEPGSF